MSDFYKKICEMIKDHQHWIAKDVPGWENMRADLSNVYFGTMNLYSDDLSGAILKGAVFSDCVCTETNFSNADLSGAIFMEAEADFANFNGANLTGANFSSASLEGATFLDANLTGANLTKASIRGTNFTRANMHKTNLNKAYAGETVIYDFDKKIDVTFRTDFTEANLDGADLTDIILHDVDLSVAKNYH